MRTRLVREVFLVRASLRKLHTSALDSSRAKSNTRRRATGPSGHFWPEMPRERVECALILCDRHQAFVAQLPVAGSLLEARRPPEVKCKSHISSARSPCSRSFAHLTLSEIDPRNPGSARRESNARSPVRKAQVRARSARQAISGATCAICTRPTAREDAHCPSGGRLDPLPRSTPNRAFRART